MQIFSRVSLTLFVVLYVIAGGAGISLAQNDNNGRIETRVDDSADDDEDEEEQEEDEDDQDDDSDEDEEDDELEIEAEAEDGETKVKIEYEDGSEEEFTFQTTDRDEVIAKIAEETDLSEEEIEAVIEFEREDDGEEEDEGDDDKEEDADSGEMVTICHQTGAGAVTIEVNEAAKERHLENHDDSEGPCDENATTSDDDRDRGNGNVDIDLSDVTPEQIQAIIDQIMERIQQLLAQIGR